LSPPSAIGSGELGWADEYVKEEELGSARMRNLLKWFIFSVLLAIIPLGSTYIHLLTNNKAPDVSDLLAHGELALISFVLAAEGVGDLIASGKEKRNRKILCGGGCILAAIGASLYFADVSLNTQANPKVVFQVSLWIFAIAIVNSGMCKALVDEGTAHTSNTTPAKPKTK
jgi:hypothetical protein